MKKNMVLAALFALVVGGFAHAATVQEFEAEFTPIASECRAAISAVNAAGSSKALGTFAQRKLNAAIEKIQNFFDKVSSAAEEVNEQVEMQLAKETPDLNVVATLKSHARKLELLKNKAANLLASAQAKIKE